MKGPDRPTTHATLFAGGAPDYVQREQATFAKREELSPKTFSLKKVSPCSGGNNRFVKRGSLALARILHFGDSLTSPQQGSDRGLFLAFHFFAFAATNERREKGKRGRGDVARNEKRFRPICMGGEAGGKRKGGGRKAPLWLSFRGAKRHFRESLRTCAHIYKKKKTGFVCPATTLAVGAHYPNDVSTQAETKEARIRDRPTICHDFVSAEHNSHEGIGGRSDENVYKKRWEIVRDLCPPMEAILIDAGSFACLGSTGTPILSLPSTGR